MKVIKCTAISDTHTYHDQITLPGGDFLFHAGDHSFLGQPDEVYPFMDWLAEQPYKHKVFIAGNHDWGWEPLNEYKESRNFTFRGYKLLKGLDEEYKQYAVKKGITYLNKELVELEGLRIYGIPDTPYFYDWAFNYERFSDHAQKIMDDIPENLDVLITHGPAQGIRDDAYRQGFHDVRPGCEQLRRAIIKKKPRFHVFGHLHKGYGITKWKHTTFINAATCTDQYEATNPPIIWEIIE